MVTLSFTKTHEHAKVGNCGTDRGKETSTAKICISQESHILLTFYQTLLNKGIMNTDLLRVSGNYCGAHKESS